MSIDAKALAKVLAEHWSCESRIDGPTVRWSCGIETPSDGFPHYTAMQQAHLATALADLVAQPSTLIVKDRDTLAQALHDEDCRDNPGHAEWTGCIAIGPCRRLADALLASGAVTVATIEED